MNKLPKIAMGAWAWGDTDGYFGNTMTREDFRPIFDAAVKAGLNLWDTATAYSNGESEKILGRLVNDAGREKIIVSTKFTPQMAGMYEDSVVKMCEASLERMNMEYFDIYWIHNPIGAPEYTKQLIPLLQSGKVKSVGVSNHNLAQIKEADEILKAAGFRVSAVQNHYSLLNRSSEESGILDYCKANNIVFYGYMTLEQGALSGKYDAEHPFPEGSARAKVFNPMLPQIEVITAELKWRAADSSQSSVAGGKRDRGDAFLERLPLEDLSFFDLSGIEKPIQQPDEPFSLGDETPGYDPVAWEMVIYRPWGNFTIFYGDFRHSDELVPLLKD